MKKKYDAPIIPDEGIVSEPKYNLSTNGDNLGKSFRYADKKNSHVLLGTYRMEKNQLSWILGENPSRYEKLYNVRINEDLFSMRNGGLTTTEIPEFILIYDYNNVDEGYHLFPCISSSVKKEDEMKKMAYPSPNGSYAVYLLGDEIQSEPINMHQLLKEIQKKKRTSKKY